jgi:hypothetical protein
MRVSRIVGSCLALLLCGVALSAQPGAGARVVVTYDLTRMRQIASDQIAVWIEDANGAFVRTLYVSNYAGKRAGWKKRPQVTPAWVKASNPAATPQSAIDAVSGATPRNGTVTVTWDLRDASGSIVPDGDYKYRVEGNISWEKTVLWTGTIHVGGTEGASEATAVYSVADASLEGKLISAASAQYVPGK